MTRQLQATAVAAVLAALVGAMAALAVMGRSDGSVPVVEDWPETDLGAHLQGQAPSYDSIWIGGAAFTNGSGDWVHVGTNNCEENLAPDDFTTLSAPVELPDGSRMQRMAVSYFDDRTAVGEDVEVKLYAIWTGSTVEGWNPAFSQKFSATSSNGPQTGYGEVTDARAYPNPHGLVDNDNYTYQVTASINREVRLCGVRIDFVPPAGEIVYPVTPCPIYDSRPIKGGPGDFAANETRTISVMQADYSAQGGEASDCGIPSTARGLMVTVNALNSPTDGSIRVWPHGAPIPTASILAFSAGTRATVMTPMAIGDGQSIDIRNGGASSTSIRLIVVGYLDAPPA